MCVILSQEGEEMQENRVSLIDFAEARGEKPNTIRVYIRRKPEFDKHISFEGKKMMLDEEAVRMLEQVYKLPKPIEVVEDTESRKALIIMQQKYIELQNEMQKTTLALEERSNQVALLELREKDKEDEVDRQREELKELRARMEAEQKEFREKLEAEQKARMESETKLAAETAEKQAIKSMGFFSFRRWKKGK